MKVLNKILIIIAFIAFLGVLFYSYFIYALTPSYNKIYEFEIKKGENLDDIGKILKDAQIIKDPFMFKLYLKINGKDTEIKAGEYKVEKIKSIEELIAILEKGQEKLIKYTIPEGYNVEQIALKLSELGIVDREEFIDLASKRGKEFNFMFSDEINDGNLEGFLFPDTYFISEPKASKIIQQMLGGFEKMFDDNMINKAKSNNMSIKDVVTLASIVEKEAKLDSERPIIASIFLNRLTNGWKIESCATVEYIVKKNADVLSLEDLEIDSPYNTYKYSGLPPGPICNPGKKSIIAAIYPSDTQYFYFVSKGDGSHAFSKTYKEHEENIRKYLK